MARPKTGRDSIFRGKFGGVAVRGVITAAGARAFEVHRRRIARIYKQVTGRDRKHVSDADVVEFLARGEESVRKYLESQV